MNSTDKNIGPLCLTVTKTSVFMVITCLVAALVSCAVSPSETTVERAIAEYFEKGHYKVVGMRIGEIRGIALSEKTYMGTPGYVVDVVSITLEPQEDKGIYVKKGSRLTFTNAAVRIRQDTVNKNIWHVSIISGISVP